MGGCCSCCRSGKACASHSNKPLPLKKTAAKIDAPLCSETDDKNNLDVLWEPLHLSQDLSGATVGKTHQVGPQNTSPKTDTKRKENVTEQSVRTTKPDSNLAAPQSKTQRRRRLKNGVCNSQVPNSNQLPSVVQAHAGLGAVVETNNSSLVSNPAHDASQLRYVYRLFRSEPATVGEVRMALPSIKALAHDESLQPSESRPISKLVDRLQSACKTFSSDEQLQLSTTERTTLHEALKSANLLQETSEIGLSDVPTVLEQPIKHNGQLITCSSEQQQQQQQHKPHDSDWTEAEKDVRSLTDLMLQVASNTQLSKHTYELIKQRINNLLKCGSDAKAASLCTLEAPSSLVQDLERFVVCMDQTFDQSDTIEVDMKLHSLIGDLITRLNPLITSFDAQSIEFGLQTLYDAAIVPEAFHNRVIHLDQFTSAAILRALEQSYRDHQLHPASTTPQGITSPRNLWSVVNQLIERLSGELGEARFGRQKDYCTFDLKEGMLIQHVLLNALTLHGIERSEEERDTDATFYQICTRKSDSTKPTAAEQNGRLYGSRSPELLSPISELCTPDTSTCETEATLPDTICTSPPPSTNPPAHVFNTGPLLSEQQQVSDLGSKNHSETTSIERLGTIFESPMTSESRTSPDSATETLVSFCSKTVSSIPISRSIARQLSTYLRSKLLDNIAQRITQPGSADISESLERLCDVVDRNLMATTTKTTEDSIHVSAEDAKALGAILTTDNSPYARILWRSIEPYVEVLTSSNKSFATVQTNDKDESSMLSVPDTSAHSQCLLVSLAEQPGQYISSDEAKQVASFVLQRATSNQLSTTEELVETFNGWLRCSGPVFLTEAVANQLKLASASLSAGDTTMSNTFTIQPGKEASLADHAIPIVRSSSAVTEIQVRKTEPRMGKGATLSYLTGAFEVIKSLSSANIDWEQCSEAERNIAVDAVHILCEAYPQLDLPQNLTAFNLPEMWPLAKNVINKLSQMNEHKDRWIDATQLIETYARPENAQISGHDANTLADVLNASVMRIVTESGNFRLDEATCALALVERLARAEQSNEELNLHKSEQSVLAHISHSLQQSSLDGSQIDSAKNANLAVVGGILNQLSRSDEASLTSGSCAIMLACLPDHASAGSPRNLVWMRANLIQALRNIPFISDTEENHSHLEAWNGVVRQISNQDSSAAKLTCTLKEMTTDFSLDSPSAPTEDVMRRSLVDRLTDCIASATLTPTQYIQLARGCELLKNEEIPLTRSQMCQLARDLIDVITETGSSIEVATAAQVYLASTQCQALLRAEKLPDSTGLIPFSPKECIELWTCVHKLTQSDIPAEIADLKLLECFAEQVFTGVVSSGGWSLSPILVQRLSSEVNRVRNYLRGKQEMLPPPHVGSVYSKSNSQTNNLNQYVHSQLNKYILDQPVSFQAWHCIRDLAKLVTSSCRTSDDSGELESMLNSTLARLLIYTDENDWFDTTQKSIAMAHLNLMELWLTDRNDPSTLFSATDGYLFAFVLSQLAWRQRAAGAQLDGETVAILSEFLAQIGDRNQLTSDLEMRNRLLQLTRTQMDKLQAALMSNMDPQIWDNFETSTTSTEMEAAVRRQQGVSLVALIATALNLPVDNEEAFLSQRKQCVQLITHALNYMHTYDLAMNRVDLENLRDLLEQSFSVKADECLMNETGLLNILEGVQAVSNVIENGNITDRTEALTVFSLMVSSEQMSEHLEPSLNQGILAVKNVLGCLLATSSDVYPFTLEQNLAHIIERFVIQVSQVTQEPIQKVLHEGFHCVRKEASLTEFEQKQQQQQCELVRSSTSMSGSSQFDGEGPGRVTATVLTSTQQTKVAKAIVFALASISKLGASEQTRECTDLLLRLQSDKANAVMLSPVEVNTITELLTSAVNDPSGQVQFGSSEVSHTPINNQSADVVELIPLSMHPIVQPTDALGLNSSLSLALQNPHVQQDLSQSEKRSLQAVQRRLLFAAVRGQSVNISSVQPLIQRIGKMLRSDHRDSETELLINRLEKLAATPSLGSEEISFDTVQRIDPETSDWLHQCLHEQLRARPATLATTLPVMSTITELEAANEPQSSTEYLNEEFAHSYSSFTLSPSELQAVINFLRRASTSTTARVDQDNQELTRLSEQVAALLFVRNAADGESIWPSEARLLLSALETLAVCSPDARRLHDVELAGLQSRLASSADLEESVQNLYEGVGFDLTESESVQLTRYCALVAPKIDDQIAGLIHCVKNEHAKSRTSRLFQPDRDQVEELCRVFLLYLSSKPVPELHELTLMNRVASGFHADHSSPEMVHLIEVMCASSIQFSLQPTEPTSLDSLTQITRSVPAFVPDLLEQALNQGETQLTFKPSGSLLLSNILNFLTLLDYQPGCERLVPKWSSHLKRLALQILYSALLNYPVRLDVRSRALLSIACKYYKVTLTDVSQDMVDAADRALHGKTALDEVDRPNRVRVAECLCVALASPMRYNLSPVRAGFIAGLAEALQTSGKQILFDTGDMQLVCETVHSLSDLESKVRECPDDTFTLLSCLQTVEQFLDLQEQSGAESAILSRRDAAVIGAALEVLMNVVHEEPRFDSWDSDDPSTISQDCKSALGLTQCFLSSLVIGANLPALAKQSARLTCNEVSNVRQLVNYWKPRLLIDAQRQRTASIRKLSVSTECDLTADITNQQLVNAVQLTVIHGRIGQPQEAWLCIQTLEQLVRSPANEYISISNSQRDALRLAMCPVRNTVTSTTTQSSTTSTSTAICLSDPALLASMIYLYRILTASTTSTFGNRARFCVQPADVAAFATSLRTLLDYFVGDLTHKEAFAVLRVMEQRMRCTAANLEDYWITQPESRAIREVLHYLCTSVGKSNTDQLSTLLSRFEKSAHGERNEGPITVELDVQAQKQLLQVLRVYILLAADSLSIDYGALIDLLDYLMYSRPASLTERHISLLEELLGSDLPQLAIHSHRTPGGPRLAALRSNLNHLTAQQPHSSSCSNTAVTTVNLCIQPREAASVLCILNALNACAKCVDPSLIVLQSALAYCVATGNTWTTWSALPPNSQLRIRQALSNCIDDLVARLLETHGSTWSARELSGLELAKDSMLRLLELPDQDLVDRGMTELRLVSLLLPEEEQGAGRSLEENTAVARQFPIARHDVEHPNESSTEGPDTKSLMYAIQCLEMSVLCDNVLATPEGCLESLRAVHLVRSAHDVLRLASSDQSLLQELEVILCDLATRCLRHGTPGHPVRTELRANRNFSFASLERLLERIQSQCNRSYEAKVVDKLHKEVEPDKPTTQAEINQVEPNLLSCELSYSRSVPLSTASTVEICQPMEGVHRALGRFLSLCNSRVLQPREIFELNAYVDMLYRATHQLTSKHRGFTEFSPIEREVLQDLQLATENNQGYTLSPESADILQALGQRLSSLALQANQDLLRNGLELWLTASVDGKFVFDDRETQQLHSALCLARDTLRKEKPRAASDEALEIVDKVIEQFSSTVDSGIGTEITGPHCLGPAVTEVLEGAQRAHELISLPASTLSGAPSTTSDWCISHRAEGLHRQRRIIPGLDSNATDDDGISDQLDGDGDPGQLGPSDTCPIAEAEPELSRAYTSDENLSTVTEQQTNLNEETGGRSPNRGEPKVGRRHTIDQVVGTSVSTATDQHRPKLSACSPTLLASVAEEQKRLKTWEKLVEARLSHACRRVESLLAALPQPDDKSSTYAASEFSLTDKSEEVQQLRDEVLGLKDQLRQIVGQLESAERVQRRQAQFASSMRELMENQRQLRMHLISERAGLFSADNTRYEPAVADTTSDRFNRLYRSSDCLKDVSPPTVIHPHHSQVVLYKPIGSESLDLSLASGTQHRFSSLDRLHELIEIRRAVVAGSREELCRLGVYSSMPLRPSRQAPFVRPLPPRPLDIDSKSVTGSETTTTSGPRILHRLLERQRSYTRHLIGRATYEQDQSSRVLDALEQRLTNLELQVTPNDSAITPLRSRSTPS